MNYDNTLNELCALIDKLDISEKAEEFSVNDCRK